MLLSIVTLKYCWTDGDTYVAIQSQASNLAQGKVFVRPHFRHVENIDLVCLRFIRVHYLHEHIPHREVSFLNRLVKVVHQEIRIFAGYFDGGFTVEILDSYLRFDVNLDILETPILPNRSSVLSCLSWNAEM